MSHLAIYKFFDELDTLYNPAILHNKHMQGEPVPYSIIDNFLPSDLYDILVEEINLISEKNWMVFSNEKSYRKECRNFIDSELLQAMAYSFQGSKFLKWLEQISGIEKLIADPHLRGGGITKVPSGSSLGLHNDFNWNEQIRLTRRVNIILYMNDEWQNNWGGDLEFWNFDQTKCVAKIAPVPNRLAIWNYDERHIHGHPYPLNTPKDVYRQNFIQFYYSSNATHETPPHRSQFL